MVELRRIGSVRKRIQSKEARKKEKGKADNTDRKRNGQGKV